MNMIDRKELKRKGRQILKAHYAILIIACLLSGLIATEFSDTFTLLSTQNESYSEKESTPSSKLSTTEVFKDILNDDLSAGEKDAETIREETIKEDHSAILGRSRGVLAI